MAYIDHIRVFRDEAGEYRWTAYAANGEPVADSDEGYIERTYARETVLAAFGDRVKIIEDDA